MKRNILVYAIDDANWYGFNGWENLLFGGNYKEGENYSQEPLEAIRRRLTLCQGIEIHIMPSANDPEILEIEGYNPHLRPKPLNGSQKV